MKHYLIHYNRRTGVVDPMRRFSGAFGARQALRERFAAESTNRDPDVEVVVIEAASEEALRRTHPRYFRNVGQLIDDAQVMARRA